MDSISDELCAMCYVCALFDACAMCIFTLGYHMHSKPLWNLISPTSNILPTLQCPLQPITTSRSPSLTPCEYSLHPCMSSSIPLRLTTQIVPKNFGLSLEFKALKIQVSDSVSKLEIWPVNSWSIGLSHL